MNARPLTIFKRESYDSYDKYCDRKDQLKQLPGVSHIRHEKTGNAGDYRWHILWDQAVQRPEYDTESRFKDRLKLLCERIVMDSIEWGKLKKDGKGKAILPVWQSAYEKAIDGYSYSYTSMTVEFLDWLKKKPGIFAFAYRDAVKKLVEDVEEQKRALMEAGIS